MSVIMKFLSVAVVCAMAILSPGGTSAKSFEESSFKGQSFEEQSTGIKDRSLDSQLKPRSSQETDVSGMIQGRITNGSLAEPKQFPYQVGLMLYLAQGRAWCGGTLISDRWVLTAAHCAVGIEGVDVYAGTTNRSDRMERGRQVIFVGRRGIHVHAGYNAANIVNDIALLKLPVRLALNDYIRPAMLPRISEEPSSYVGARAIASGWGRISDAAATVTDVLRYIEVPIVSNSVCNNYYFGMVKESNICTSSKNDKKSTCNGDSGGPLVLVDGAANNILIGATSFGISLGCEVGFPAAFTRITSFLKWIEEKSGVANR